MLKALLISVSLVAALFSVAPALADPVENAPFRAGSTVASVSSLIAQNGDDAFATMDLSAAMSSGGSPTQHYGPYPSGSPDSSTCGNDWAQDTFDRHFTVKNNNDGTFSVVEQFKNGSFLSTIGPSPGGCDTDVGGTIRTGVGGGMHGYLVITVTGVQTSQDPNCTLVGPCTTTGFIQSHFTPPAFTIGTFFFHYSAGDQGLFHGEWKNASADRGGNHGDITGTL